MTWRISSRLRNLFVFCINTVFRTKHPKNFSIDFEMLCTNYLVFHRELERVDDAEDLVEVAASRCRIQD